MTARLADLKSQVNREQEAKTCLKKSLWLQLGLQKPPLASPNPKKTLDFIGGRCRFRTCDPRLVRPMLYR